MLIMNRVPVSPLNQVHNEMSQLFNSVFGTAAAPSQASGTLAPPMNVWEQDDRFFIEAELPGFSMDDIEVSVLNDEVTITGARKPAETEGATYLRRERRYGSFTRTWTLPTEIDAEGVEASLNSGVLLVSLPKSAKAQPRKIEVKVAKK